MIYYIALIPFVGVLFTKRVKSLLKAKKEEDMETVKSEYIKLVLMSVVIILIIVLIESMKQ